MLVFSYLMILENNNTGSGICIGRG